MPNYEYQCTACDTIYELWQEVGAAPPPCPECASVEVKKVFHPPRVHFKGSGFYLTDLRAEKESKSAKPKTDADAAPAKAAESEIKTDAKAETKTETKPEKPAPASKAS